MAMRAALRARGAHPLLRRLGVYAWGDLGPRTQHPHPCDSRTRRKGSSLGPSLGTAPRPPDWLPQSRPRESSDGANPHPSLTPSPRRRTSAPKGPGETGAPGAEGEPRWGRSPSSGPPPRPGPRRSPGPAARAPRPSARRNSRRSPARCLIAPCGIRARPRGRRGPGRAGRRGPEKPRGAPFSSAAASGARPEARGRCGAVRGAGSGGRVPPPRASVLPPPAPPGAPLTWSRAARPAGSCGWWGWASTRGRRPRGRPAPRPGPPRPRPGWGPSASPCRPPAARPPARPPRTDARPYL